MGAHSSLGKELRPLNRIIRWTAHGITWEPDPRHVELIVQILNLDADKASPADTPGTRDTTRRSPGSHDEGEYRCEECNLVHAYDRDPVPSKVSSLFSTTSGPSARRTGDVRSSMFSGVSSRKSQFGSSFNISCDGCSTGTRSVDAMHGMGELGVGCLHNDWTRASKNVWMRFDFSAKEFVGPGCA